MKILAIYNGHTASAALLENGKILAAASEERFSGVKNQVGYPKKTIEFIFKETDITPKQLDYIAIPQQESAPLYTPQIVRSATFFMRGVTLIYKPLNFIRKSIGWLSYYFKWIIPVREKVYAILALTVGKLSVEREKDFISKDLNFSKEKILSFDHHLSHAASAYYGSGFAPEKALVLTMDGEGDSICASVNIFEQNKITTLARTSRTSSLGLIYMYLTGYLGMKMTEHEYKVMGLAPYAKEQSADKLYEKIKDIIVLDPTNKFRFKTKFHASQTPLYLQKEMVGERFDNIAAAFQKLLEVRVLEWVNEAINQTGITTLALAGGVFMNVKLNQKIMGLDRVKKLFITPSCGDESSIFGAGYLATVSHNSSVKIEPMRGLYLGPAFTNNDVAEFIEKNDVKAKYKVEYFDDIQQQIAQLLSQNKIVGRMAGKMEFGARALGNRSILANPSDPDVVMIINEQMKDRDFWMPFAPSILREREHDYIVNPKNCDGRYMVLAFDSTLLAKKEIRAALHPYDFTCRPQIVDKNLNPAYHRLIKAFEGYTGIGAVLNTSFNLHGHPIVLGPAQAFNAFEKSGLVYLALENYLISKE